MCCDFGLRIADCGSRKFMMATRKIVALILVIVCGITAASAAERTWTRSEILATADREARRLGWDVERSGVSFDYHNRVWWELLRQGQRWFSSHRKEWSVIQEKLRTRKYWAVFYSSLAQRPGVGAFIFIDQATGEVIDHFNVPGPPQTTG